jgi:hypothetical protein
MRKMQFFYENMLVKFLGFDRMHEKKIIFVFVKGAINLKYLRFFENCFLDFF